MTRAAAAAGLGTPGSGVQTAAELTMILSPLMGDIGSFVGEAAGFVADPLGSIIAYGLDLILELVAPLKQLLQMVTGNPAALTACSAQWRAAATELRAVKDESKDAFKAASAEWMGAAADACGAATDRMAQACEQVSQMCDTAATALDGSADLMSAAEDLVKGIIVQVVKWCIATQAIGAGAAVVTAGASVAAAQAACAVQCAIGTAFAAAKVARVVALLVRLTEVMSACATALEVAQFAVRIGKDVYDISGAGGVIAGPDGVSKVLAGGGAA
ncbi:WXG100 family type VII secretion target [Austwickia chelonae]|uniref:WXG100 family type VII secretion target n=1 Tax=Austwickia chelonae TaxID=100225 RepID=UPI000E282AFA|nr:WXG100 family type VII secretion target [Austwickia chelonae]